MGSKTSYRPVRCTCCDITWSSHPDFLNHLTVVERLRAHIAEEIRSHPNARTYQGRFVYEHCAQIAEGKG